MAAAIHSLNQGHLRWVIFSGGGFLTLIGESFIIDERQRTCPWTPAGLAIPRSRLGLSLGPRRICLIFSGNLLHDHIIMLRKYQIHPTVHAGATAELGLLRLGAKPLFEVSPGKDNSAGLVNDILDAYKRYLWCDRNSDPAELALARWLWCCPSHEPLVGWSVGWICGRQDNSAVQIRSKKHPKVVGGPTAACLICRVLLSHACGRSSDPLEIRHIIFRMPQDDAGFFFSPIHALPPPLRPSQVSGNTLDRWLNKASRDQLPST
jgi:hypothetical protein